MPATARALLEAGEGDGGLSSSGDDVEFESSSLVRAGESERSGRRLLLACGLGAALAAAVLLRQVGAGSAIAGVGAGRPAVVGLASSDDGKDKDHEGNGSKGSKGHETSTTTKPTWMSRRGSFMVIGDWGYDPQHHWINIRNDTCVSAIAEKMSATMKMLGDVQFVINVGDSFYPNGVRSKDDPQWENKWRNVFDDSVRSVPWYSVYGNHDYQFDPCACSDKLEDCAQVHDDPKNLSFFQMPSWTYHVDQPELNLEIIGLDLNHYMNGFMHGLSGDDLGFADCQHTMCKDMCFYRSKLRAKESLKLFEERAANSAAKNLLVFSHYPTDYFSSAPDFMNQLKDNSKHDVFYFGGHRHNTDQFSTASIAPNVNWLVGGGGGWSCDGQEQGFVVGEIGEDYSIKTYSVLVDYEVCCIPPSVPTTTSTPNATGRFPPVWNTV